MVVTVPVSNSQRIVCAVKRTGVSPTILRAALLREQFITDLAARRLWNALADEAGVDERDIHGNGPKVSASTRFDALTGLLFVSADEIATASAAVVADILTRRTAILEDVQP